MRGGVVMSDAVRELIEPTVAAMGYELVDVERAAHGLLRVTVDVPAAEEATRQIGLEDCERISHQLTHLLAVEDVDYQRLEISSPGLDRPLNGARDFIRFTGSPVQLQLKEPLQGRRRFRGQLLGVEGPAGGEKVRLALMDDDATPGRSAARPGARRHEKKAGAAPREEVVALELSLADIEKARLVPQFDFKGLKGSGTRKGNQEGRR